MANEHDTSAADQALADEWAAALEETGDVGQADIDALLAADAATKPASNRLPMEEFGSVPRSNEPVTLDGPKGPYHEPKPGILTLAYKTGAAVVLSADERARLERERPHLFYDDQRLADDTAPDC